MTAVSRWLSRASYDPATTLALWAAGETAPLLVGREWRLVRIDFALAAAAVTGLRSRRRHIGPYLMGGAEHAMWWLLPLGEDVGSVAGIPGVTSYPKGSELFAPPPGKYLGDRVWVLPDPAEGQWATLTAAAELREVLGTARPAGTG
ncbi:hypothetical protein [Streptomyces hiroshimensis]|uniref:DNA primase/polymerase bifunctional N-terminal domain-containing protein n=1 Tax=Streptomyces hiroshimensis TaxID=66424 RepID=A0ABQ2YGR2_9ACTN|nr:hypothetical protein [Streptomyces hiroshimensis]GGX83577.1 hypothetical protein GCM10010324_31420 [Streptomyces hiroshimensis]